MILIKIDTSSCIDYRSLSGIQFYLFTIVYESTTRARTSMHMLPLSVLQNMTDSLFEFARVQTSIPEVNCLYFPYQDCSDQ
jgi:hypothetical protein